MGKRSLNHPAICEKHQANCMWRLTDIFDFLRGRPYRKLLSNGRHGNEHHVAGTGYPKSRHNLLSNFDEKGQGINDGADNRTFKLQRAHQLSDNDWQTATSSGQMATTSDKLNLAAMTEAIWKQVSHENGKQFSEAHTSISLELVQMSEETEAFIDKIFRKYHIKDWKSHRSQQFLDAVKILNPNKELFLKLLKDPNSLSAKHIKKSPDLHAEKEISKSISETISRRNYVEAVCSKEFQKENVYSFLWNKFRSPYGDRSSRRDSSRIPSRMVVLKPGSRSTKNSEDVTCNCSFLHSRHGLKNRGKSVKPSYFSYRGTKRKMKCAMGDNRKEKHWNSKDGGRGNIGKSATRNVKTSSDLKTKDSKSGVKPEIASLNKRVCKNLSLSTVSYSKQRDCFDMYLEAKRHLSERLSNVDEDKTFSCDEAPRTLGRILSLPQHDFLPIRSPKRDIESGFFTAQKRFSPYSNLQENKTSCLYTLRKKKEAKLFTDDRKSDDQLHIFDTKPDTTENLLPDTKGQESICSIADDFSSQGYVKNTETNMVTQPQDYTTVEVPASASGSTWTSSAERSTDTANMREGFEYLECSRPESPSQNLQLISSVDVSPSTPLSIQKLEFGDNIGDRTENPSPVSVFGPFFTDDITSPPSCSTTKPANSTTQPLHIDFEEKDGYQNGDKLFLTWQPLDQLLSPSFFDKLELPPVDSSCDHKLLFDCVDEVVSEVGQYYFSCSPCLSFLNPKIQPVPVDKIVVHEVKKRVDRFFLSPMVPRRLEQIVGEDVAGSATWIDTRHDTEDIVVQVVESILEELIPEAIT